MLFYCPTKTAVTQRDKLFSKTKVKACKYSQKEMLDYLTKDKNREYKTTHYLLRKGKIGLGCCLLDCQAKYFLAVDM